MNKAPLDIIAENLPTFLDLYRHPPKRPPTMGRLVKDAQRLMAALAMEGFEIVRKTDDVR